MAGINFSIGMGKRKATVNVMSYWAAKYDIPTGEAECTVLGLFQDSSDQEAYPVFVCELASGNVMCVAPQEVKFIKEVDDEVCTD
jgi:hypothetical protein